MSDPIAWLMEDLMFPKNRSVTLDRAWAEMRAAHIYEGSPTYKVTPLVAQNWQPCDFSDIAYGEEYELRHTYVKEQAHGHGEDVILERGPARYYRRVT